MPVDLPLVLKKKHLEEENLLQHGNNQHLADNTDVSLLRVMSTFSFHPY